MFSVCFTSIFNIFLYLLFLFNTVTYVFIHASYHRDDFYGKLSYRIRESRELIQCPVESCDGSGHISGNFATHRRQAEHCWTRSRLQYLPLCKLTSNNIFSVQTFLLFSNGEAPLTFQITRTLHKIFKLVCRLTENYESDDL